jgi:hypothetical protein
MRYRIRYNKSAGQPGRGTVDHKWRIFDENNKELLCKQVVLKTMAWSEMDPNGHDHNLVTDAQIEINRENSTITFI